VFVPSIASTLVCNVFLALMHVLTSVHSAQLPVIWYTNSKCPGWEMPECCWATLSATSQMSSGSAAQSTQLRFTKPRPVATRRYCKVKQQTTYAWPCGTNLQQLSRQSFMTTSVALSCCYIAGALLGNVMFCYPTCASFHSGCQVRVYHAVHYVLGV